MDWKSSRLFIMGGVALALLGLTSWAVSTRTGDTEIVEEEPTLPELERDAITALEIQLPASEDDEAVTVRLAREGEDWRLMEPVEAAASSTAVSTALDKLTDLDVVGRAAREAQHHERLEVDEASGIRVIATTGGDSPALDMWVGAYRSGNTMVRVEGSDEVLMVQGSIKFAFNKRPRDWRDRGILQLTAAEVQEVEFQNERGHWLFRKGDDEGDDDEGEGAANETAEGEAPAEGEGDDDAEDDTDDEWRQVVLEEAPEGREPTGPVENFEPAKVRTIVSSLARLRASDFAAPDATPESLGLDGSARVRMVTGEGEDAQTVVIRVGDEHEEGNRYVMVDGDDTIYVVSRFMAERLLVDEESFQPGDPEPAAGGPPGGMPGMPGGMPGMPGHGGGGPGGGQIPPEVMRQLQQQLQAEQAGGG
jgi:hypothetical protein